MALDAIAELGARNVHDHARDGCFALFREERQVRRYRALAPRSSRSRSSAPATCCSRSSSPRSSTGSSAEEALRLAVAAGAASTLEVGAGRFDPRDAGRLVAGVEVAELAAVV